MAPLESLAREDVRMAQRECGPRWARIEYYRAPL